MKSMTTPTDTEMMDFISAMREQCEGRILTRIFMPSDKDLRQQITEMMADQKLAQVSSRQGRDRR